MASSLHTRPAVFGASRLLIVSYPRSLSINELHHVYFAKQMHLFISVARARNCLFGTSTLHTWHTEIHRDTAPNRSMTMDRYLTPDLPGIVLAMTPNSFKCAMTAGKKRLTWFVVTNTCYKVYDNLMTICQTCWYRDASKSQLSAENQVLSLPCFVKKHYGVSLAEVEKTPLVLGKFCREFLKSLFLLASWKDGWTHLQQNILRKFVLGTEGQWDFLSGIGLGEVQFYLNQAKTRFVMNLFEPSLLCVRMKKTKKMRRHQLFFGCKYRRFPPGHWDGF